MRRELGRSWLPSKADHAAECSIPHPSCVPGKARNDGAAGKRHGRPKPFTINLLREKELCIFADPNELFPSSFRTQVVGSPPALERVDVTGEIGFRWPDELNHSELSKDPLRLSRRIR
jgi:hypothetical protein